MVRKEDVDFYCGFSRKELQSLCKKYHLPANKSSSDMADSLASYFEKSSFRGALATARKNCFQGAVVREPSSFCRDNALYQEQNGNGGLTDSARSPSYTRESNEKNLKANSKKEVFRRTDSQLESRMKEVDSGDSRSSSSFEFHVSLEEGISLSVDLNFNPSEWIKSMRDKVNVCDSMRRRKSPRSDLGINSATECKKQKSSGKEKDEHVRRESSITPTMKDNSHLPFVHHSNGEWLRASSTIKPCSKIKEDSDTCREENGLKLSISDLSGPGQIVSSCVESFSKSCRVNAVDLDCVIAPAKKLTSDSIMVAQYQNQPASDLLPSMEIFQKVENSSIVICPRGAGSELSSSEAEAYHSNTPCSPRKISRSSTISSPELIVDRESTSHSESFQLQYNGGKNYLPPNTEEQEKSEVLSEQVRSE